MSSRSRVGRAIRETVRRSGGAGVIPTVLLTVALSSGTLAAQDPEPEFDTRGSIVNPDGTPLEGAMVVALTRADSVLAKFARTDGEGAYLIRGLAPGDYILQVSFVGFQTLREDFSISTENVDLGRTQLEILAFEMDPLVVSPEQIPFIVRRDTLIYNALAFPTRINASVEELLEQLPGIEVAEDGSIKAQGEDVQKVLVEGKEFFGDDPTVATQQLPADAVARVEVYDKESDTAEFTGIPDGEEEKTINLVLKEDSKSGAFGTVEGGFGSDMGTGGITNSIGGDQSRYTGSFNLNRFSESTQLSVVANASTLGGGGGGQVFEVAEALASRGVAGVQGGGGFTDSKSIGLNGSFDFDEDRWIRGSYYLRTSDRLQEGTTIQQQLLGSEVSSLMNQANNQRSENSSHRLNLNTQYAFSEGHDLRVRGNFNLSTSSSNQFSSRLTTDPEGDTLNTSISSDGNESDSWSGTGSATWRRRFGEEGRSLVAEATLELSDPDRTSNLSSTTELFEDGSLVRTDEVLQDQRIQDRTLEQTQRLSWIEPFGSEHNLELYGSHRSVDQDQSKTVFDLVDGESVFNSELSSGFNRLYSYWEGGVRFNRNVGDSRWVFGVEVQNSDLDGTVTERDERIRSGYTHVLPSAIYRIQTEGGRTFTLRYTTSTREPTLTQLQPFTDNSNPLRLYTGNPDLSPEYRHSFRADYRTFDRFNFTNLFGYTTFRYTTDAIVMSRTVDERALQQVTPVNAGGEWTWSGGLNYGRPIRWASVDLDANYSLSYSKSTEFIGGAENGSRVVGNSLQLSFRNRNRETYTLRVGGRFAHNDVDYTLNEELNRNYLNSTLFANGRYNVGDLWSFTSSLNYRLYDEEVFGPGRNTALLEATVSRTLLDNRGEIRLSGFDLLNQNQGVNVSTTSNYIQEQRSASVRQHFVITMVYRLGRAQGRRR